MSPQAIWCPRPPFVYTFLLRMSILQVLPALRDHYDEYLLQELINRWDNHKIMVRWLSRFFNYLDRCAPAWCHVRFMSLPCLAVARP